MTSPRRLGRPPLFDQLVSERAYVKVTPAQRAALQHVARVERVPAAAIIRRAVDAFVSDYGGQRVFGRKR